MWCDVDGDIVTHNMFLLWAYIHILLTLLSPHKTNSTISFCSTKQYYLTLQYQTDSYIQNDKDKVKVVLVLYHYDNLSASSTNI